MTLAPESEPLRFSDLNDVAAVLKAEGTRMTTPRRLVLQALFAAEGLVSAEQVATGSHTGIELDLTSVYRNLERLEELGLVRHVHLGHGPGRYLPTGVRWEFVVCDACGEFAAVEPDVLDRARDAIRAATGYAVRFAHFPVVGTCPACCDSTAPANES
jgi:Fur family ferric uptake transcriptional regulator